MSFWSTLQARVNSVVTQRKINVHFLGTSDSLHGYKNLSYAVMLKAPGTIKEKMILRLAPDDSDKTILNCALEAAINACKTTSFPPSSVFIYLNDKIQGYTMKKEALLGWD